MFTLKSKTDNVKNANEGKPMDRRIKKLENLDYWFTLSRVAALGSMNKAAEELNIDVSSVSNKIRVLEKALGYELLERQSHSSFLTAQGESVLKTIFPIVEDFTYTVNFQRFPTLDAKKLVNAPKMSAHHRGICHF